MKIKASVPVEKVQVTPATYTFRSESQECEVVRLVRRRCGSRGAALKRFYYQADIKKPANLAPEYSFALLGADKGLLRVNVERQANPKWKPPVFADGCDVYEVPQ